MANTETLTLRIDASLKRWLEKKAESEKRSASKQAEHMLLSIKEGEAEAKSKR